MDHLSLHVVPTVCSRFRPFGTVPVLFAASICQHAATMCAYKITPRVVASPHALQTPLVRKRARSGGTDWVKVARETTRSKAKRPRTAGSQRPACIRKDYQMRTTAEAASFASQFSFRKVHPTKASPHEFLATWLDVDLEKKCEACIVAQARVQINRWTPVHCSVPCIVHFPAVCSKLRSPTPPPNRYISEMVLSYKFQKVYIYGCGVVGTPRERYFGTSDEKFKNPGKKGKTHRVGVQ